MSEHKEFYRQKRKYIARQKDELKALMNAIQIIANDTIIQNPMKTSSFMAKALQ